MTKHPPQAYALLWTGTIDGCGPQSTLCEIEAHVIYEIGTALSMRLEAQQWRNRSKENGWASTYRAVPLPFTGPLPEFARGVSC